MIERAVEFCLQRRLIVILATILVFIYGLYSWTQLKLEAYPDVGDVTVIVTTQARDSPRRKSSSRSPCRSSARSRARPDSSRSAPPALSRFR
ncbi:hypothetical protein WOA01_23485 [Methylocystis sp. IM2]|uniref:hypothetical protein n=1 Tax=Methylocystis sp. IM2 TaxID=3136563 RepID=UPI0030FAE2BE